jgi:hypothetical protein
MKIQKGKQLDFTIEDVNNVYSGPVGVLWEMLMGEQILMYVLRLVVLRGISPGRLGVQS